MKAGRPSFHIKAHWVAVDVPGAPTQFFKLDSRGNITKADTNETPHPMNLPRAPLPMNGNIPVPSQPAQPLVNNNTQQLNQKPPKKPRASKKNNPPQLPPPQQPPDPPQQLELDPSSLFVPQDQIQTTNEWDMAYLPEEMDDINWFTM